MTNKIQLNHLINTSFWSNEQNSLFDKKWFSPSTCGLTAVKASLIQHFSAINGKVYKPDRRFNVCRGSRIQNKKGVYPTKTGDMKFYDWLDDFISILPGIFRRLWPLQAVSLISLALVGCEGGSNHHKILICLGTTYTDHAWDTWTIVNIKYIWILHTHIYIYMIMYIMIYIIIIYIYQYIPVIYVTLCN